MNLLQKLRGEMKTPRLILRKWAREDMGDFLLFASDEDVTLPAGSKPVKKLDEAEAEFRRALRDDNCFAIVLKETGRPIGKIRLQNDTHRQNYAGCYSVAYQMAKSYWGRGLMPEALTAMTAYAFEKKKVEVLGVSHFAGNSRSQRVIEKCGFVYEGTARRAYRRFDGKVFDDVCYSMLREEYLARKASGLPESAGNY